MIQPNGTQEKSNRLELQAQQALELIHELTGDIDGDCVEIAQLVANLGAAAVHLYRSASLLRQRELPDTTPPRLEVIDGNGSAVEDSPETVSLVALTAETSSTEEATAPERPLQEAESLDEIADAKSVDVPPEEPPSPPRASTSSETGKPAANRSSENRSGVARRLTLDPEKNMRANAAAFSKFGNKVRLVEIIDDEHLVIGSQDVATAGHAMKTSDRANRIAIVEALLNHRGMKIPAADLTRVASTDNLSTVVRRIAEELCDENGSSIITIEKINARKQLYSIAADVVVTDTRVNAPEPKAEPADIASPSSEPEEPEVETQTAQPEDQGPESRVIITQDELIIDGLAFSLTTDESSLLAQLQRTNQALDETAILQSLLGKQEVDEDGVEVVGEQLFNLYKQGLLIIEYDASAQAHYRINSNAAESRANKVTVVVKDKLVYFDEYDITLMSRLAESDRPYSMGGMARLLSEDLLPQEDFDMLAQTIKKYYYTNSIVQRVRFDDSSVAMFKLTSESRQAWQELVTMLDQLNGGSPVEDHVLVPLPVETTPPAEQAESEATPSLEEALESSVIPGDVEPDNEQSETTLLTALQLELLEYARRGKPFGVAALRHEVPAIKKLSITDHRSFLDNFRTTRQQIIDYLLVTEGFKAKWITTGAVPNQKYTLVIDRSSKTIPPVTTETAVSEPANSMSAETTTTEPETTTNQPAKVALDTKERYNDGQVMYFAQRVLDYIQRQLQVQPAQRSKEANIIKDLADKRNLNVSPEVARSIVRQFVETGDLLPNGHEKGSALLGLYKLSSSSPPQQQKSKVTHGTRPKRKEETRTDEGLTEVETWMASEILDFLVMPGRRSLKVVTVPNLLHGFAESMPTVREGELLTFIRRLEVRGYVRVSRATGYQETGNVISFYSQELEEMWVKHRERMQTVLKAPLRTRAYVE